MKKLLSTRYSAGAFNTAMLLLRLGFGILMMHHGYQKLQNFSGTAEHMPVFFGMSGSVSAALVIFAEFFCAIFIILGLFTRFAAIPPIISMSVALFKAHDGNVFGAGEMATLYIFAFLILLLVGPGKVSVDGMIGK